MDESSNYIHLPIIPLPRDVVLLPGATVRVPVQSRPEIGPLLTALYKNAAASNVEPTAIALGCVPLCSPLLSSEGQHLLEDSPKRRRKRSGGPKGGEEAAKKDLFAYGTVARISSVAGQRPAEAMLILEGQRRFRVERYTQFKPFIECEASLMGEDVVDASDAVTQNLFRQLKVLSRELLTLVRLVSLLPLPRDGIPTLLARRLDSFIAKKEVEEAGFLADFMTQLAVTNLEEKLQVLASLELQPRLELVVELLTRQINQIKGSIKVTSITSTTVPASLDITELPPQQREALMRSGINDFMSGLIPSNGSSNKKDGNGEDEVDEIEELRQKLEAAKLTPDAQKVANKELRNLRKMNPAQAEYNVCRTYLETLAEIPWTTVTEDQLGSGTLQRARQQLDDDHYGLDKIKKRLLEYLAVLRLKQTANADLDEQIKKATEESTAGREMGKDEMIDEQHDAHGAKLALLKSKRMIDKSPILLLLGPPGTGKTSLAKSVAAALGRKFHRISLGGVRDEAEIRGHRRTYVAAMPGLIVSGLRKVGVSNPVFLLDEIDKVGGANFHGDPSAAMLEVLDPEQNHTFVDHYLGIPLDLSRVLFVATANTLDTIPPPLLDRMETVALPGYTPVEKRHIARRHLLPKQIRSNGLAPPEDVQLADEALDDIIQGYTREAGVRSLERHIGAVCRAKAVEFSDSKDRSSAPSSSSYSSSSSSSKSGDPSTSYNPNVTLEDIESILGPARFEDELAQQSTPVLPGVVTGLVAYSSGISQGSILFIEMASTPSPSSSSGSSPIHMTGTLGAVLKESVEVALSWVKAHAYALKLVPEPHADVMARRALHVHCPAGAVPKDGPSAGLAHAVALVSLFSQRPVEPTLAMTGEISLRGRILPVGGIREKCIGALRAGVKTVLLPARNAPDLKDLPDEVVQELNIQTVSTVWDALHKIWPESPSSHPDQQSWIVQSRL